jgi:hypothetical protein
MSWSMALKTNSFASSRGLVAAVVRAAATSAGDLHDERERLQSGKCCVGVCRGEVAR